MADAWHQIPGFLRSPNISGDWRLYEIENRAADPDHVVERAMQEIAPWDGKILMDVGAGTDYHIERFHESAGHVIAVEPDPELRLELMQRLADRRSIGIELASREPRRPRPGSAPRVSGAGRRSAPRLPLGPRDRLQSAADPAHL